MPIKKAAAKALRQSKKGAARNSKVSSDIEALTRKTRKAIAAKDQAKALEWLRQVSKRIDKGVQNGVLKKNTAARKKSRLAQAVNALVRK